MQARAKEIEEKSGTFDPLKHFTQQKHTTVVPAEGSFELPDLVTSKYEVYETLARAYRLLATLSGDAKLAEFVV